MEVHVFLASRDYYDYLPDATIFFATVKQKNQFTRSCLNVLVAGGIASYFQPVTSIAPPSERNQILLLPEKRRYLLISTDATITICFATIKQKK